MKIKLAILENDSNYLNRIVGVFNAKYSNVFEIYSFTDMEMALNAVAGSKIDVMLADDAFDIDVNLLPKRCSFAYLADTADIESIRDQRAICKFQKVELLSKQILSLYSENDNSVSNLKFTNDKSKLIVFTTVAGGCGATTMAVACAMRYASQGIKTLYLNLETFGQTDSFLHGEGQFSMSDVIFALKRGKSNFGLKLESCVKQDASGVYFYSQPQIALDMMELSGSDLLQLISELQIAGAYDRIVIDQSFGLDKDTRSIFRKSDAIILVDDGAPVSNAKTISAFHAMSALEQEQDAPFLDRIVVAYNQFSNKTCSTIDENIGIRSIGGAPRYEHASVDQILQALSVMDMFDNIV